jgi:hypothetical protein
LRVTCTFTIEVSHIIMLLLLLLLLLLLE